MTEAEIAGIASWTAQVGLEGRAETALVEGFCRRALAAGLPHRDRRAAGRPIAILCGSSGVGGVPKNYNLVVRFCISD
jgi:hypothetical protein